MWRSPELFLQLSTINTTLIAPHPFVQAIGIILEYTDIVQLALCQKHTEVKLNISRHTED